MEYNNKAIEFANDIIRDKKYVEKLSYKDLDKRFTKNNDRDNGRENFRKEYVLFDIDVNKAFSGIYQDDVYKYLTTSSQQKVWEAWAGGYSLFATCVADGQTERFERVFHNGNVKAAYVISEEIYDSLHQLIELR